MKTSSTRRLRLLTFAVNMSFIWALSQCLLTPFLYAPLSNEPSNFWFKVLFGIPVVIFAACLLACQREVSVRRHGETLESRLAAGLLLLGALWIATALTLPYNFNVYFQDIGIGIFFLGGAISIALGLRHALLPDQLRLLQQLLSCLPYLWFIAELTSRLNTTHEWYGFWDPLGSLFHEYFYVASVWREAAFYFGIITLFSVFVVAIISHFYCEYFLKPRRKGLDQRDEEPAETTNNLR